MVSEIREIWNGRLARGQGCRSKSPLLAFGMLQHHQTSSCLSLSMERKLQLACDTHFPCADDFEAIAAWSNGVPKLETKFGEPILFFEQNGTEVSF